MNGFKLIALRPLEGCNSKFLKNLREGELYLFYKDFHFINKRGESVGTSDEVISIKYKPSIPESLYNLKSTKGKPININISAVVGKNGSGKSALSEFLLYYLFLISNELGYIIKEDFIDVNSKNIDVVTESHSYDVDVDQIKTGLKGELYYSMDNVIYKLKIANNKINLFASATVDKEYTFLDQPRSIKSKADLSPFFYSMLVNYSLYAFNTYQIGNWIKAFFHKNDGYQTPVVISPFREKGNIDINKETYLTSARLLANVLSISNYKNINQKSQISKIELYFDAKKDYRFLEGGEVRFTDNFILDFRNKILVPLFSLTFNNEVSYPLMDSEINKYAEIYLINKLITIPTKYRVFESFDKRIRKRESQDNYKISETLAKDYVRELLEDKSHVTLKVRQTLNFLRKNIFGITDLNFKSNFDLKSVVKAINSNSKNTWHVENINYLPPPFLFSRIKFKDGSYFQQLSSGEKQKIYALNSIIYHLKNIDSVHKNKLKNNALGIVEYDTINLLLDEVELYYHPEFQKSFIVELLGFIKKADFKNIKNLNIMLLTHSPFVLSDIPVQNVTFLSADSKTGKTKQVPKKKQTFAANIHDLLAEAFFLKDTLMGKFADKQITNLIKHIKKGQVNRADQKLLNIIGDTFLKSNIKQFEKNHDKS